MLALSLTSEGRESFLWANYLKEPNSDGLRDGIYMYL